MRDGVSKLAHVTDMYARIVDGHARRALALAVVFPLPAFNSHALGSSTLTEELEALVTHVTEPLVSQVKTGRATHRLGAQHILFMLVALRGLGAVN